MPDTMNPSPMPKWRSSVKQKHGARVIEYGDDYEERAPRGVFTQPKYEGSLAWESLTDAQADTIETFWQDRLGSVAFYLGVPEIIPNTILLVSDEFERIPAKYGYWDLTMKIRSVPNA